MMNAAIEIEDRKRVGRAVGITIVVLTLLVVLAALWQTDSHPRTDDATVRVNYITVIPEVSGLLVSLPVKDNQHVKKGDLLFEIDCRPYDYDLQQALANQTLLESQIGDEKRRIAAEGSAVDAARAGVQSSRTGVQSAASNIDASAATVARAQAAASSAEAQLALATANLGRIEPLLAKQYVTFEQVDQVRTAVRVAKESFNEAQATALQARAQQEQAAAAKAAAEAGVSQAQARLGQAVHTVDTLDTLIAQRAILATKVQDAALNVERCRVIAPFDGYVTNLNISEGAYAHPGTPMFTLLDMRNWFVIANYRESKLKYMKPGMHADIYLMGHPDHRYSGTIESIGYGVLPEDAGVSEGLPDVDRTLNWVHLSARFPVRIHVDNPDPQAFRMGETAVSIIR
jgi:multidrug efflux system membrane fusion protein